MVLNDLLNYRRVLLLQGPIGPFFTRLARFLRAGGSEVCKINFNGGDATFFPGWFRRSSVLSFTGKPSEWRSYVSDVLTARNIDAVVLFGDCRFYHRIATKVAQRLGVAVFVFEEGYLRPDYITLERDGVNGHSTLPREQAFYSALPRTVTPAPRPVGTRIFYSTMTFAIVYGLFGTLFAWRFPFYRHHQRYFSLSHGLKWVLSAMRKQYYRLRDRGLLKHLTTQLSKQYFLVPLQVQRDAQVLFHSRFRSVEEFIEEVVTTFAIGAPRECCLVFKHHPMDRGFHNYRDVIEGLGKKLGIAHRIFYVHDLHLPMLIKHARGTLVINSTVGLSSLLHGTPVKVMGKAIYDIPGLVHQGSLKSFWHEPEAIDRHLHVRFREYLISKTQVNGSFYYWRGFQQGREYLPIPAGAPSYRWVPGSRSPVHLPIEEEAAAQLQTELAQPVASDTGGSRSATS